MEHFVYWVISTGFSAFCVFLNSWSGGGVDAIPSLQVGTLGLKRIRKLQKDKKDTCDAWLGLL